MELKLARAAVSANSGLSALSTILSAAPKRSLFNDRPTEKRYGTVVIVTWLKQSRFCGATTLILSSTSGTQLTK
jgi:hypothetical protein